MQVDKETGRTRSTHASLFHDPDPWRPHAPPTRTHRHRREGQRRPAGRPIPGRDQPEQRRGGVSQPLSLPARPAGGLRAAVDAGEGGPAPRRRGDQARAGRRHAVGGSGAEAGRVRPAALWPAVRRRREAGRVPGVQRRLPEPGPADAGAARQRRDAVAAAVGISARRERLPGADRPPAVEPDAARPGPARPRGRGPAAAHPGGGLRAR